jgi:hypothetical protein
MDDPKDKDSSFGDIVQDTTDDKLQPTTMDRVYKDALDQQYPELKLSPTEAKQVREFMGQLRLGGSGGVRLICTGDDCDYRRACPLWQTKGNIIQIPDPDDPTGNKTVPYQETKAPLGQACPIEATVVMQARMDISAHPGVDMQNTVHQMYVNEICLLSALEWRTNMLLAYDHHSITQEVPAAISPDGSVYTKREMNQLIEALGRINDRRSKIMTELTISPLAEYKRRVSEGEKDSDSKSKSQASTMAKVREAEKQPDALPIPEHIQLPGSVSDDSDKKEKTEAK